MDAGQQRMKYLSWLMATSSADRAKWDSSLKAQWCPFLARERLIVWRARAAAGCLVTLVILALSVVLLVVGLGFGAKVEGPGEGDLEGDWEGEVVVAFPLLLPFRSFLLGMVPRPEVDVDVLALGLLLLLLPSAVMEAAVVVVTVTSSLLLTSSVVVGVGTRVGVSIAFPFPLSNLTMISSCMLLLMLMMLNLLFKAGSVEPVIGGLRPENGLFSLLSFLDFVTL